MVLVVVSGILDCCAAVSNLDYSNRWILIVVAPYCLQYRLTSWYLTLKLHVLRQYCKQLV